MKDKKFLMWLKDRLIFKYHENPDIDFIHKLQSIIDAYPKEKETSW